MARQPGDRAPLAGSPRARGGHTGYAKGSSRVARLPSCVAGALALAGCAAGPSVIHPAGRGADRIADLFWWTTAGSVVLWLAFVGLAIYAGQPSRRQTSMRAARRLILFGGVLFPTVLLAGLLAYGLAMLPPLLASAPEGSLRILVTGEQWWWRVRYLPAGSEAVHLANEVHLPVGVPVEFRLESADVIHSFWIPPLGGKIDMIPGRQNHLTLLPTKTGIFAGICAEYCGTSHALMRFFAVVEEKEDFDRWLARQAEPARRPTDPLPRRGSDLFLESGCGGCHSVRGTPADGVIGPDLTHVGSRLSLGAGTLANRPDDLLRWVAHTKDIKPSVHMPAFGMLPQEDLRALAAYLESLE